MRRPAKPIATSRARCMRGRPIWTCMAAGCSWPITGTAGSRPSTTPAGHPIGPVTGGIPPFGDIPGSRTIRGAGCRTITDRGPSPDRSAGCGFLAHRGAAPGGLPAAFIGASGTAMWGGCLAAPAITTMGTGATATTTTFTSTMSSSTTITVPKTPGTTEPSPMSVRRISDGAARWAMASTTAMRWGAACSDRRPAAASVPMRPSAANSSAEIASSPVRPRWTRCVPQMPATPAAALVATLMPAPAYHATPDPRHCLPAGAGRRLPVKPVPVHPWVARRYTGRIQVASTVAGPISAGTAFRTVLVRGRPTTAAVDPAIAAADQRTLPVPQALRDRFVAPPPVGVVPVLTEVPPAAGPAPPVPVDPLRVQSIAPA